MATTLLYNNKSIQSQSPTRRKDFLLNPMQLLIIPLLLLLLVGASGNSDWLQSCGVCYCNWNSGKKTADCKDRSLQVVPTDLSTELQVVDLSNNIIAELRRDQFQDANLQNLHKIFMRNCTLQELNRDALKGLAILIELDLSHNFIRILHSGTFSGLVKLRNLVMNNNEIEILDDYLFADLEFLSRVEFKHNRLKHIAVNAFGHLPMLSAVYLESNQLHVLRKETFNRTPKLLHLSLAQNPWNCTCELQQFRDYALMHRLYTPPTDCHEPKHLRGKLWSEIPSENFACRPKIIKPTIRPGMSVNSYVEATNENVTLKCHIQASPQPVILWLYNKRPLNINDQRYMVRNSIEQNRNENTNILTSELIIYGVRSGDKGTYTCIAENRGGKDEFDIQLFVNVDRFATGGNLGPFSGIDNSGNVHDSSSNVLLIICLIATTFLLLLIIVVLVICWYCRRIKSYHKDPTMSENGLITSKIDKSHNGSLLEGSVIMEMQKSLLTEVNPVEKPPRRTEIENVDGDDGHEIKKTLLDETAFGHHQHHHHHHQHIHRDEETHSLALSDTTPRSRHTYVDDGYGTNLPPDLLSFPARVPASPSMQSSTSNIPDNVIYGKSPLSSPVYHHVTPIYGTATTMAIAAPNGFMTLQHPKSRNLALVAAANSRNQSPFMPAPVVYSPVVMKQGYMTIPRKPRVPSWTPSSSHATQLSEFQSPASPNPSETGTAHTEPMEPVYDNLGLRTTAGGNSVLNLNKVHNQEQSSLSQQSSSSSSSTKYSMKDRPLPATPNNRIDVQSTNVANAVSQQLQHHPHHIQQQQQQQLQQQQQHYHQQQQLQQQQQHQQSPPPPKQLVSLNNSTNSCTTNGHSAKLYEPINELVNNLTTTSDTEPLYGTARHHSGVIIVPSSNNNTATSLPAASSSSLVMEKISKIPPRPPPKPKKKMSVTSRGQGSTSQLFDDEGEDGTEV